MENNEIINKARELLKINNTRHVRHATYVIFDLEIALVGKKVVIKNIYWFHK